MAETKHGYLVLADISGYTGYLAQVELEHAHEILADLLETIIEQFRTILQISKLEGDAVFANVDEGNLARPESLLELIENTYVAFRRRRDSSQRATTCTCRACQNMQTLELKFFVHHGDYIVQNISGIRELVGSDVNLIHRLTKNHVAENTGWHAYVLFSKKALTSINLALEGLHEQDESYEHLGTVSTRTLDLLPRYEALISAQRVIVTPQEADLVTIHEFNAPLATIWDWLMDIKKRNDSMGEMGHWKIVSRNKGRTGTGSSNHCAHGRGASTETIMDWRPFEYATVETVDGMAMFREMAVFTSLDDDRRTRVEWRLKMLKPVPLFVARFMLKRQFSKMNPYEMWFSSVDKLLARQPVE
jgi:class 3 adenylate cyclase